MKSALTKEILIKVGKHGQGKLFWITEENTILFENGEVLPLHCNSIQDPNQVMIDQGLAEMQINNTLGWLKLV